MKTIRVATNAKQALEDFYRRVEACQPGETVRSTLVMNGQPLWGGKTLSGHCYTAAFGWVRSTTPPPAPAPAQRAPFFCDDAEWTAAVARQGVGRLGYDDVLQSDHWRALRDEYRTGRCVVCKRDGATQLHHVTYQRLGAERPEDVIELCASCHASQHARQARKAA